MQFNVERNVFLEGVQRTLSIVEKKTTLPILSNILISTEEGKLKIVATDREIGLISYYDVEIISPGEITLSGKKLFEMIREVQGNVISFKKEDNNWVTLMSDKVVYNVPGIPVDDFPEVSDDEDVLFLKIKGNIIKEMTDMTFFAMSKDETKAHLNGIFLEMVRPRDSSETVITSAELNDNLFSIRMVATDGSRLSLINSVLLGDSTEFPVESSIQTELAKGIIIPRKGVGEIRKLLDEGNDYIELGVKKRICILKKDNVILKVNLVDSEYPNYREVIPVDKGISIQLNRDQFLHSLRRMSVISSDKSSFVKIKLIEDMMILNSTDLDIGKANEEIEISYKGKEFEIIYNVNYLIDAIQVINGRDILFEMRAELRPGVIREAGNDDYMCVVMPLKMW